MGTDTEEYMKTERERRKALEALERLEVEHYHGDESHQTEDLRANEDFMTVRRKILDDDEEPKTEALDCFDNLMDELGLNDSVEHGWRDDVNFIRRALLNKDVCDKDHIPEAVRTIRDRLRADENQYSADAYEQRNNGLYEEADRNTARAEICQQHADELDRALAQHGEGRVPEKPLGAIHNAEAFFDRLENHYSFECDAGPLSQCTDWLELRRCFDKRA